MNINERMPHYLVTSEQRAILDSLPPDRWIDPLTASMLSGASEQDLDDLVISGIVISNPAGLLRKRHAAKYDVKR